MSDDSSKPLSRSVALAADKARAARVARVKVILDTKIDNAIAVIDALMAEIGEGESHVPLWEQLHASSMRDRSWTIGCRRPWGGRWPTRSATSCSGIAPIPHGG